MNKISQKKIITIILSMIIITLAVGSTNIYIINKQAKSDLLLFTQNKANILEDTFKKIEISTNKLANQVRDSFSADDLNKYGISYMKTYSKSLIPFTESLFVNAKVIKGCYFNFDPDLVKGNNMYETWVYDMSSFKRNFGIITEEPKSNLYPTDKPCLDWFYKPKNSRKPVWSDTYTEDIVYSSILSYTVPVYIHNKFIGVSGMDISIEKIRKIISNSKLYETGYVFLLDKNFNTLVYKNLMASQPFEKINPVVFTYLKNNYAKNKNGIISYKYQSNESIDCYKVLNNGMILISSVPKAEILKQKFNLGIFILGVSLLGLALIISIFIYKK